MIARRARLCKLVAAALAAASLAGCVVAGIDMDALRQIPGQPAPGDGMTAGHATGNAAPAQGTPVPQRGGSSQPFGATSGETIGRGPVRVALLLPLTGDPALASMGQSMANGARLAMAFIEANPNIADNLSIALRDTGTAPEGAAQAARAAVGEGASLVLGPLLGDQMAAASAVTRQAGIPMIAFASNGAAAGPGVYLLSVLPEVEVRRGLAYAKAQGRTRVAGLFPNNAFGSVQKTAFEQGVFELGLTMGTSQFIGTDQEIEAAARQLARNKGGFDALYLPDPRAAPKVLAALAAQGVRPGLVIGSTQWSGMAAAPALAGAVYPAVDDAGLRAITPEYVQRFGSPPHPLATIAYTAVILVNNSKLSMSNPRYDRALLTNQSGFTGRDGVFRFLADGRSQYALVMRQVGGGVVDAARL